MSDGVADDAGRCRAYGWPVYCIWDYALICIYMVQHRRMEFQAAGGIPRIEIKKERLLDVLDGAACGVCSKRRGAIL